jgi:hypothetical protein
VVAVVPVGLWATLLCCPQIHRFVCAEDCGPAQPAWREVRTCRIGEAGTAPTSTAKSRIDAVPHTLLSTHAGAVFQSLPIASMCTVARGGDDCPAVSVRALPKLRFSSAATVIAARFTAHKAVHRRRGAMPSARGRRYQASRRGLVNYAARAGRYRARQNNVTHQGSPPHRADDLVTASAVVIASKPPSASPGDVARPSPGHRSGSWR